MKNIIKLSVLFSSVLVSSAAFAQVVNPSQNESQYQYVGDLQKPAQSESGLLKISVGAGTVYSPAYVGAEKYTFKFFPDIRIDYDKTVFFNGQDGLGYNFYPTENWRVGPVAKVDFGRPEDGGSLFSFGQKTPELRGLGDVDPTFELGGFSEFKFADSWAFKVEVRQGIGGHEGLVADTNLNYMTRAGDITLTFGPRMKFADDNYINSYFGITPGQSAASGYSVYNAGGGVFSYGLGGAAIMPLTESVKLAAFLGYDRLASEVSKSPLVKQRGQTDQVVVGTSVTYDLGL
jgi:outer membrane protein